MNKSALRIERIGRSSDTGHVGCTSTGGGYRKPEKRQPEDLTMKTDINEASERLAADSRITDYDFWRSLKNVDNEIFQIANRNDPIPMEMIRWRAILKQARSRRGLA
ncbi:hypothetical protein ABMA46_17265 [Mesorhizobium sp. CN5-321]|uniref:hypothetical protein n=1 Tax=Mesorhizobium hunchu TaxID=3157708 RepID=UPI0032B7798C